MNAPDKKAALAHYEGQAAIAELARWQGKGLMPRPGCGLHQTSLDDAEVWIEYEYEPASGDGWNEPREEASVTVIGILINGVMCDAQDVAPHMVDEWSVEIMEALNDDAQSQFQDRDDSRDDEAADRASDRYERDLDARASQ